MWRNDMKCKYMFMLPVKNLARKGLINSLSFNNSISPIALDNKKLHGATILSVSCCPKGTWKICEFLNNYRSISLVYGLGNLNLGEGNMNLVVRSHNKIIFEGIVKVCHETWPSAPIISYCATLGPDSI